jgi:hypothetical protein
MSVFKKFNYLKENNSIKIMDKWGYNYLPF